MKPLNYIVMSCNWLPCTLWAVAGRFDIVISYISVCALHIDGWIYVTKVISDVVLILHGIGLVFG